MGEHISVMNTQEAFRLVHNKLKELHDRCFPLQTISKTDKTRRPWLSDSLRDATKKKNTTWVEKWNVNKLKRIIKNTGIE